MKLMKRREKRKKDRGKGNKDNDKFILSDFPLHLSDLFNQIFTLVV